MLYMALMFLVVALIAGVLGLTGIAGLSANIAWILFVVGLRGRTFVRASDLMIGPSQRLWFSRFAATRGASR